MPNGFLPLAILTGLGAGLRGWLTGRQLREQRRLRLLESLATVAPYLETPEQLRKFGEVLGGEEGRKAAEAFIAKKPETIVLPEVRPLTVEEKVEEMEILPEGRFPPIETLAEEAVRLEIPEIKAEVIPERRVDVIREEIIFKPPVLREIELKQKIARIYGLTPREEKQFVFGIKPTFDLEIFYNPKTDQYTVVDKRDPTSVRRALTEGFRPAPRETISDYIAKLIAKYTLEAQFGMPKIGGLREELLRKLARGEKLTESEQKALDLLFKKEKTLRSEKLRLIHTLFKAMLPKDIEPTEEEVKETLEKAEKMAADVLAGLGETSLVIPSDIQGLIDKGLLSEDEYKALKKAGYDDEEIKEISK